MSKGNDDFLEVVYNFKIQPHMMIVLSSIQGYGCQDDDIISYVREAQMM